MMEGLSEYLAKWQRLTGRQRDILTALALGYEARFNGWWYIYAPDGSRHSKTYSFSQQAAWHNTCPYFTCFSPDCGAFVKVWSVYLEWCEHDPFHPTYIDEFHECLNALIGGEKQYVIAKWFRLLNPADALGCACVWARLQEEPGLWEKFEEAIG